LAAAREKAYFFEEGFFELIILNHIRIVEAANSTNVQSANGQAADRLCHQ
jgi:hypothetical protein